MLSLVYLVKLWIEWSFPVNTMQTRGHGSLLSDFALGNSKKSESTCRIRIRRL